MVVQKKLEFGQPKASKCIYKCNCFADFFGEKRLLTIFRNGLCARTGHPFPSGSHHVLGLIGVAPPSRGHFWAREGSATKRAGSPAAAVTIDDGNFFSGHFAGGVKNLADGDAEACTEIATERWAALFEVFECFRVSISKIEDMDVITNAGPVRGVVVGAKDGHGLDFALNGEKDIRDEMGLGVVSLADEPVPPRAGGVESSEGKRSSVPKRYRSPVRICSSMSLLQP